MDKALTLADVAEMTRAAKFLKDCGIMALGIIGYKSPSIHISCEGVLAVAKASKETPVISATGYSDLFPWHARVEFDGVIFFCLLNSASLLLFGYEPEGPDGTIRRIKQLKEAKA